ncbi:MAG: deoxyribose-phosphate aldolase [Eubacterium sp.]|nr:deoxyribose-phosphate aldolase [Eubacterium sp.]
MKNLTVAELANYFDHTWLKPDARYEDFVRICGEAVEYGFKMVAINSVPVRVCKELLAGTAVHVGAAIGFPLGQTTVETKRFEVEDAIRNGTDEIDYVINIGQVKDGKWDYVRNEMETIIGTVREHGIIGKVIFENCYLTKEEIARLSEMAAEIRPDFIKTSTGMGTGGATLEDVRLMKSIVGDAVGVKAAGGIRDLDTCLAMIEAGATRIGSSSGIAIVEEYKKRVGGI